MAGTGTAVIKALETQSLTVRAAAERAGFAAAGFSHLHQANLARFTLDRLIRMLQALDPGAFVSVWVEAGTAAA